MNPEELEAIRERLSQCMIGNGKAFNIRLTAILFREDIPALLGEIERLMRALRLVERRRESWYDAMGDDKAGAPNDEAEKVWEIARDALAGKEFDL